MKLEVLADTSSYDELITAVTRRQWAQVRRTAANPWFGDHSSSYRLDDIESLYALALATTLNIEGGGDHTLLLRACNAACLGLAIEGQRSYFNLKRDAEEQLILAQILNAALANGTVFISKAPLEQYLELLQELTTSFEHSETAQWLSRLFSTASRLQDDSGRQGSSQLAQCMWNCLTGTKSVGRTRGNLLYLLFRWKRLEALEELCKATTGRHANLVCACLQSFEHAEANPQAHPRALQLLSAVEEQLAKEGLPWKSLFSRLKAELLHAAVSTEPVSITAEFREFIPDGGLLIDLRIEPSLHDVPNTLTLRLGSENDEAAVVHLFENEPLIDEITQSVRISRSVVSFDGDNPPAFRERLQRRIGNGLSTRTGVEPRNGVAAFDDRGGVARATASHRVMASELSSVFLRIGRGVPLVTLWSPVPGNAVAASRFAGFLSGIICRRQLRSFQTTGIVAICDVGNRRCWRSPTPKTMIRKNNGTQYCSLTASMPRIEP